MYVVEKIKTRRENMKRKAIKQFFKIEPSKWPYNPKRYFKRNGVETADNIKAIKSVYETIPETKRHYKNLPVQYREAKK